MTGMTTGMSGSMGPAGIAHPIGHITPIHHGASPFHRPMGAHIGMSPMHHGMSPAPQSPFHPPMALARPGGVIGAPHASPLHHPAAMGHPTTGLAGQNLIGHPAALGGAMGPRGHGPVMGIH